ncbi:MAG TPA: transposase [Ktedonobacteraceae bacterium]
MGKATKTIKQRLEYRPSIAAWFETTQTLFNQIAEFYFEVIQAHPGILDLNDLEALAALEQLTHATKAHCHPPFPLTIICEGIPAMFRRATINVALGSARALRSQFARWHKRKVRSEAKGKKYTIRPPAPPRVWNRSPTLYAGMWKDRQKSTIMLKLWTGTSWAWVKIRVAGQVLLEGWEPNSPSLVPHKTGWWLHTPVEKRVKSPGSVAKQIAMNPETRICAVDLNLDQHSAVCTIQTGEGTVLATRFTGNGKQAHGFRKSLLGRIARRRSETGIIALGEQDNAHLWAKVRHLDEQMAHLVSRRIVDFARQYGATVLVFEHLGNLRPEKGRYSKRSNAKRMYWLKGRIFRYARYKAWAEGIVTCRVSPWNTSRECARCHASIIRYAEGQPVEGYRAGAPLVLCSVCHMRGNADRNASIVIGQRLISKHQEKPLARPKGRSAKAEGLSHSQDAKQKN